MIKKDIVHLEKIGFRNRKLCGLDWIEESSTKNYIPLNMKEWIVISG